MLMFDKTTNRHRGERAAGRGRGSCGGFASRRGVGIPAAGHAGRSCSLSCLQSPHPSASASFSSVPRSTEGFCPARFLCCKLAELQICERRRPRPLPAHLCASSPQRVSYLVPSNLSAGKADTGACRVPASRPFLGPEPASAPRSPFFTRVLLVRSGYRMGARL